MDVAVVTEDRYLAANPADEYVSNIHREEELLLAALGRLGLSAERRSWSDPAADWRRVRAAVLRSTWDYFHRFPEFSAWLARAARETRLINAPDLLTWNLDKHYLADLARRGIAVVPTRYVERGEATSLAAVLAETGWEEVVVKPVVSGAARLTFRIDLAASAAHEPIFASCVAEEAMMVQPFQPAILTEGELTLVVIGGRTTHAVRKVAKAGDFRVQDDYGGTVHPHAPTAEETAFAEAAVAACSAVPAYARVDAVRDAAGRLRVMELELVEPELFLRFHPPAAAALAGEIAHALACETAGTPPAFTR